MTSFQWLLSSIASEKHFIWKIYQNLYTCIQMVLCSGVQGWLANPPLKVVFTLSQLQILMQRKYKNWSEEIRYNFALLKCGFWNYHLCRQIWVFIRPHTGVGQTDGSFSEWTLCNSQKRFPMVHLIVLTATDLNFLWSIKYKMNWLPQRRLDPCWLHEQQKYTSGYGTERK